MFAALITGLNKVEMVEFPDPTPAPKGVVVDIAFCGICGTDIHAYQSGNPYNPAICGHEWSGTLSAVGSGVKSLSEGDRIVVAVAPAWSVRPMSRWSGRSLHGVADVGSRSRCHGTQAWWICSPDCC